MAYKFQLGAAVLSGSITAEGAVSGTSLSADTALAIAEGGTGQGALDDILVGTGLSVSNGAGTIVGGDATISLSTQLQAFHNLNNSDGNFVVGDGSTFVVESGATARTSLGLGSAAVKSVGVSAGDLFEASASVNDNDFLKVNGSLIEGRSAAEVLSDIGAQPLDAELTELATMASNTAAALADLTNTEVALLDGASAANSTASKAVVLDSSGDLTISGSLQVNGSLTYVNTTNLKVTDALVTFASGTSAFGTGRGFELGQGTDAEGSMKTATENFGQGNLNIFKISLPISASQLNAGDAYLPNGVTTDDWQIDGTAISGNLPITASAFVGDGSNLTGLTSDTAGSLRFNGANASVNNNITASNDVVLVDCSSNAPIITMPNIDANTIGKMYVVKDIVGNAATNNIEIRESAGTHDIDGQPSITIESNFGAVNLLACSASNGFFYAIF